MNIWHYVKNYKFNSIFIKSFLLIMILVFFPLSGLSVIVFMRFNNIMNDEAGRSNIYIADSVRDMTDMILEEIHRLSIRIATDKEVQDFLLTTIGDLRDYETVRRFQSIMNQIGFATITNDFIGSIYVYSERNSYVLEHNLSGSGIEQFHDKGWLDEYMDNKNKVNQWMSLRIIEDELRGSRINYISIFQMIPIYDTRQMGCVIINIDIDKLGSHIKNIIPSEYDGIYIIDENERILFSLNKPDIGSSIRGINLFHNIPLPDTGVYMMAKTGSARLSVARAGSRSNYFTYISIVPMDRIQERTGELREMMMLFIAVSVISLIVVAFVVSVRLFRPILNIISMMQDSGGTRQQEEADKTVASDELKYIMNNIALSFAEGKKMQMELEHRLSLFNKANAIALQSQINPHFLFNTLETINWISYRLTEGENEATMAVASLSQLLRISFETHDHFIPLENELEHAKRYLEIQKLRYGDKFEIFWDIQEDTLRYKTIKLILQPLIENAIYHGIKPMDGKGEIHISCRMEEEYIKLVVRDNGVGMNEDSIRSALTVKIDVLPEDSHIGLLNVNLRIKMIFGEQYGLQINSAPGMGAEVKIVIPQVKSV